MRGTLGDVFEISSRKGSVRSKRQKKLLSDVPPAAVPPLESNLNLPTQAGVTSRTYLQLFLFIKTSCLIACFT